MLLEIVKWVCFMKDDISRNDYTCYDFEKNAPYIEYPDGRKVYAKET